MAPMMRQCSWQQKALGAQSAGPIQARQHLFTTPHTCSWRRFRPAALPELLLDAMLEAGRDAPGRAGRGPADAGCHCARLPRILIICLLPLFPPYTAALGGSKDWGEQDGRAQPRRTGVLLPRQTDANISSPAPPVSNAPCKL